MSLFHFNPLPLDTSEATITEAVSDALHRHWERCGITFPDTLSIVILHRASIEHHVVVSDHAGLLMGNNGVYTYFEKAGGRGPFVRIDTSRISDIAAYYSTMTSPDYPWNFMSINDEVLVEVPPSLGRGEYPP